MTALRPRPVLKPEVDLTTCDHDEWLQYYRDNGPREMLQAVSNKQHDLLFNTGFGMTSAFRARVCFLEAVRLIRLNPPELPDEVEEEEDIPMDEMTPRAKTKKGGARPAWEGHNACALLRWMGAQAWKKDRALAKMAGLGFSISPSTANIQMSKGRKGEDVPTLTAAQVQELEKP